MLLIFELQTFEDPTKNKQEEKITKGGRTKNVRIKNQSLPEGAIVIADNKWVYRTKTDANGGTKLVLSRAVLLFL